MLLTGRQLNRQTGAMDNDENTTFAMAEVTKQYIRTQTPDIT